MEEGKVQGPAYHRARGCFHGTFEENRDLGTAAIGCRPVLKLSSAFRTVEELVGRQTAAQRRSFSGHPGRASAEVCREESEGGLAYRRFAADGNVSVDRDVFFAGGLGEECIGSRSGAYSGATAVRLVNCPLGASGVSRSVGAQGYGGGPAWVQRATGNLDRFAVDDREERDEGEEKTGACNAVADHLMEYLVNEDAGLQRDVSSCSSIPSFREFNGGSDTSLQSMVTANRLTG